MGPTQTPRRILNLSVPAKLYNEVVKLAKGEAKTKSEFARDILTRYIESNKRWGQIRKWGKQTAQRLRIKDDRDVERIIDECEEE